ncbi:MAG: penicillin acylase family protein [Mangrovicoccus sp.]|nr:penicillin acylase family protein [Mangrovicoccus sp.]
MLTAFRWALRLFLVVAVLGLGAGLLAYQFASRSLPPLEGRFEVAGLVGPVEIVRDTSAIPHILGATDVDSYFGLGFVHAQDRLWQMMMMRRTVQGRLSEMFGPRTLEIDEAMRRFDLYRLAQDSVAAQDPRTIAALEAYAAGVNAWLAEINKGARGRGAPEFFLFAPEIAPWQPADSLAIIKLMGVQLSTQINEEVLRGRAALMLEPARLRDLLPDAPGSGAADLRRSFLNPQPLRDLAKGQALGYAFGAAKDTMDLHSHPLSPFPARGLASASNVWAASADRAARGAALLANDPHLELTAPAIWYLARLELEKGGVIGGTIPGIPAILAGRNGDLAWGVTSGYADDLDLYVEKLDPERPGHYQGLDGPVPFREERVVIGVRGAEPETITLRWSENGPVLPPEMFDLSTITPRGHVTSMAWTLLSGEDTSMSAALDLMEARSIEEGLKAAERFIAPAQNLMLADRDNIAMVLTGDLPRRAARHDSQGRFPSRGWIRHNRWQGMLDRTANPRFRNPQNGVLGNTNNKTSDRPFPYHVSFDWGDTQRIQRLEKLMAARHVHSRESFMEAQLDTVSTPARVLLPLVAAELWFGEDNAPQGTMDRQRKEALDLLANWNGEMNEHLAQPLIYSAWMRALQNRLIADELGADLAPEFAKPEPLFIERAFRNVDGAGIWCDIVQSSEVETCAQMASLALDDALIWLQETYGNRLEAMLWGTAHQATHNHPVLGEVPVLSWFVNIRQSTSGGDHTLMRGATPGAGRNPYLNIHGAGYRGVYDQADPDSSLFVTSTGQSGHPLSRFYDNLNDRWRRGEYVIMSLDPSLARAASVGTILLIPEGLR